MRFWIPNVVKRTCGPNRPQYTFAPTHTLLLITNYKPHADARDKAFWSRACLIEFNTRFVEKPNPGTNERKADESLKEKLEAERSGILAWLVRGCLEWQQLGLNRPEAVEMATDQYRQSEDQIQTFVNECCYVRDEEAEIKASELYAAYKTWYRTEQEIQESSQNERDPLSRYRLRQDGDSTDDPNIPMQGSASHDKPCISELTEILAKFERDRLDKVFWRLQYNGYASAMVSPREYVRRLENLLTNGDDKAKSEALADIEIRLK